MKSAHSTYRVDPIFGCVLAIEVDAKGYGRIGRKLAHRVKWEQANGTISEDRELDHTCRRRACVALHHLELVTRGENELRKSWRYRVKRTTCARGHSLADALVTPEGGRVCRTCNTEAKGPL